MSILTCMESIIPHMSPRTHCRMAVGHRPARSRHLLAIACGGLVVWAGAALLGAEEADRRSLPEPIRTNRPVFTIPFRLEESKSSDDAPQRVLLSVSRDLGANWQDVDDVVPAARQFTYRATTDGDYWFRLRSVDASGRQRGGAGPDVRVILNASGPRIAARVWLGPDGEVVCRFAAFDDTLDLASLRLEYRTAAEPNWQAVDAVAMLSREAPAHLVGEELWWAGEDPKGLVVQLTVSDASGNASTQQYALAALDPGVSQHELAREIGAPPLPGSEPPPEPKGVSSDDLLAMHAPAMRSQPPGFGAPQSPPASLAPRDDAAGSSWLPGGVDAGWGSDGNRLGKPGGVASVLTASRPQAPAGVGFPASLDPFLPAEPGPAFGQSAPPTTSNGVEMGLGGMAAETWADGTYRGKPLMLSRSRSFSWDYAVDTEDAAGGIGQVELWGTRDGGVTWQRVAVDEDRTSPIDVSLNEAGLHGFRLELAPAGAEVLPPRSGDAPQCWVGVDEVPPMVSIQSVIRSSESAPTGEETIAISYASDDPLIVPRGVRVQFSPNPSGPWATIVEGQESTGRYLWKPDRTVPARAYLRVEASDSAGNVGAAVTPDAVLIGGGRPTGQLRSLRPLPPTPAP